MRLAGECGIPIPPCALIQLADGAMAFISRSFDRTDTRKLPMEDFCQLAEKPTKDRYTGLHRLSPAYDLLNTQLVLRGDDLALAVGGKKRNLTRRIWLDFGAYCGLPPKVVVSELESLAGKLDAARELIAASRLPEGLRDRYVLGLVERTRVLS